MKRAAAAIFICLTATGCGWDGGFRYPCQDPANWETVKCNPPVCNASDTCTDDLLPEGMTHATSTTTP